MATAGETFVTTLKKAHLEWGSHRHTTSRGIIYGEGYLQIPRGVARRLNIHNNNQVDANVLYNCTSSDGFLDNVQLRASGSKDEFDVLAKQFQGSGNLRLLGDWFNHVNATIGDRVKITFITDTDITITKL